ncbi:MAG: hypothetical protein WBA12_01645 [Catalinimonas sp.]
MQDGKYNNDQDRNLDLNMSNRETLATDVRNTGTGIGGAPKDDMKTTGNASTSGYATSADVLKDESYRTETTTVDANTTDGTSGVMTVMFNNPDQAEDAYRAIKNQGYKEEEISVVMSEDTRKTHYHGDSTHKEDLGNKSLEGAGAGSAIGGTVGAIVGAIAAIGTSVVLPGIGLVIAGPLAAGLAGAGAGGLTGGLIGALAGAGVPKDRAEIYESGVKDGGIMLSFRPHSRADAEMFERKFTDLHGQNIHY